MRHLVFGSICGRTLHDVLGDATARRCNVPHSQLPSRECAKEAESGVKDDDDLAGSPSQLAHVCGMDVVQKQDALTVTLTKDLRQALSYLARLTCLLNTFSQSIMFRPFAGCASLITTGLPSPLVLPSSTGSTTSESDVGTKCGMFHIDKIGDEYFTFLDECDNPKACTVILRGPSKDILNEIERNLQDAMSVARNVVFNPLLVPGGGATEMAISVGLQTRSRNVGVETGPFIAVADAMEVIPRTLAQNSGGNAIRVLTELRVRMYHACFVIGETCMWGINGEAGKIVDMKEYGLYESASVKIQTFKTAIEAARMLLRVDDVVQAIRKEKEQGVAGVPPEELAE
ncbi:hypothetical protein APHAL10511_007905 [Amanita phalloides]|nr:hypothetical protein APHAL10511_007905 [Amanita phalloides]